MELKIHNGFVLEVTNRIPGHTSVARGLVCDRALVCAVVFGEIYEQAIIRWFLPLTRPSVILSPIKFSFIWRCFACDNNIHITPDVVEEIAANFPQQNNQNWYKWNSLSKIRRILGNETPSTASSRADWKNVRFCLDSFHDSWACIRWTIDHMGDASLQPSPKIHENGAKESNRRLQMRCINEQAAVSPIEIHGKNDK